MEQPRLGSLLDHYIPEQIETQLREQERNKLEELLFGYRTVELQSEAERARYQSGLDDLAFKLRHWIGDEAYNYVSPRLHLVRGNARDDIPALAARLGVNLLVMGTVARNGIEGLIIGNTAEVILNGIYCSVLAVKPDGFVSPLE